MACDFFLFFFFSGCHFQSCRRYPTILNYCEIKNVIFQLYVTMVVQHIQEECTVEIYSVEGEMKIVFFPLFERSV